jgi:bifunctional ADP-heptose synthase (sugar kinase/adenylyltransferase)
LDAYQVVRVRPSPGAAGTIINNLVALGVKRVVPIAVIGDDGEGYELRQCLGAMAAVDLRHVFSEASLRTPTYVKPILSGGERARNDESTDSVGRARNDKSGGRELNRLDIKNRRPLPSGPEQHVLDALRAAWMDLDALIVQDQVSEAECGVVTSGVRRALEALGESEPDRFVLADSRTRIGSFRSVCAKPNERECLAAVGGGQRQVISVEGAATVLANELGRPVFCTRGDMGIYVVDPRVGREQCEMVPAYPVDGPIDVVGAGDSCSAAIACAVAGGVGLTTAAAFGNLVASITIQQIGTTGTASREQIMERWRQVYPPR